MLRRGPSGKLHLPGPAPLHFNLSPSGSLAIFAFSLDTEIGVDLEEVRPMPHADGIANRFFASEEGADSGRLRTGLEVIANHLGKRLDEDNPVLHAQLPDGSRLAAVIPPVVRPAPALTIRKFTSQRFTVDDLIARGTMTEALAQFLEEQICSGKTVLISGGTGSGKTTLLNIMAQAIPDDERIVVIEDTSELRIQKPNVLAVECQTDTFKTRITFDDLLKSALRWRPDRITGNPYLDFRLESCDRAISIDLRRRHS